MPVGTSGCTYVRVVMVGGLIGDTQKREKDIQTGQPCVDQAIPAQGVTTGHVCFTAMSFNRACPHGLHCLQCSVTDQFHCCVLSESSMAGVQDKDPTSLCHCTRSAAACWAIRIATTRNGARQHKGAGGGGGLWATVQR